MTTPNNAPRGLFEAATEQAIEYNSLSQEDKAKLEGELSSLDDFIEEAKRPRPKS